MKTLIAIVDKTDFGTALSKATGITVFDFNQYRAKNRKLFGGTNEQKAWNMLISDMEKQDIAILDNSNVVDALKVTQKFDAKNIVFISDSQENKLTYGYLGEIFYPIILEKTLSKNTNYPQPVKAKTEAIKNMHPEFVMCEWYGSVEHRIWAIANTAQRNKIFFVKPNK